LVCVGGSIIHPNPVAVLLITLLFLLDRRRCIENYRIPCINTIRKTPSRS
jgi:hypothetical protein